MLSHFLTFRKGTKHSVEIKDGDRVIAELKVNMNALDKFVQKQLAQRQQAAQVATARQSVARKPAMSR